MMAEVSVIIPTFNRADLLRSAIESAISQTFTNTEIIVSDDNSTDHTLNVVESFKDRRIKYVRNEGKKGPSATRNLAILISKGKYIAFLDDDDEWLSAKLKKQVDLLNNSSPDICGVYSNRLFVDKTSGNVLSDNPGTDQLRGNLLNQLIIKSPIHTSTVVIKKWCLNKIGLFDETLFFMEDWDLWVRLSLNWDFEYISLPLAKAYIHYYSHLSHNLKEQTKSRGKLLKRYKHLFKRNRKSWGELYICQGAEYCQLKQMMKGRINLIKGIMKYPLNKIGYFHLLSSVFGASNYQRLRKLYKFCQI